MHKMKYPIIMGFYYLLILAAIASIVIFIYYSSKLQVLQDAHNDEYESRYARSEMSAHGAIISILFAILMMTAWIAYTVHHHLK
jgi:Ca2+/Na+ antiporter